MASDWNVFITGEKVPLIGVAGRIGLLDDALQLVIHSDALDVLRDLPAYCGASSCACA